MTAISAFVTAAFANAKSYAVSFIWGTCFAIPIMYIREKVFGDFEFAATLAIVVVANALLSVLADWWHKKACARTVIESMLKAVVYLLVLVIAHGAASYKVNGDLNLLFQWVDAAIYGGIMLAELLQCIKSAGLMGIVVPKFVTARLRAFDESGNPLATPTETPTNNAPTQPTV